MSPDVAANIEERAARTAKAFKLADVVGPVVARLVAERVSADERAEAARAIMRGMTEQGQADAAALAGTRPPSVHTWAIVTSLVVERVRVADVADPFEGLQ